MNCEESSVLQFSLIYYIIDNLVFATICSSLIYLSYCFGIMMFQQLYSYIIEKCSLPFQFFWNRQSRVFKQLFMDISASFIGSMKLALEEEGMDDNDLAMNWSPGPERPCADILSVPPEEELPKEIPIVPPPVTRRIGRRVPAVRLPAGQRQL